MRGRGRGTVALATLMVLAVVLPAQAGAATFDATDGASFQAALNSAAANAGPDTVRLAAGTYTGNGFVSPAGSAVKILGVGTGTVLTRGPGPAPYEAVLKVSDGRASVEQLSVAFPTVESAGMYGIQSNGLVTDVRVTGGGEMTRGIVGNGATIRRARIETPLNGFGAALLDSTIEDSIVTGVGTGVYAAGRSVVRRSGLETRRGLMIYAGNPVTIDSTLIKVPSGIAGTGLQYDYSYGESKVVARNVTMIGTGDPNSSGFVVGAYSANQYKALDLSSSVIRGFDRVITVEGLSGGAFARADVRYSSFDPSKVRKAGFALFATGPGNLADPAPMFAPDSFRPLPGSPLVDAGEPGVAPQPRSDTDLVGRPRVTGRARDIGAYELPDTVAPRLTGARLSRQRFRARTGTRILYRVTEAGTVSLRFERRVKRRWKRAGTRIRKSGVGRNTVRFKGRVGKKRLRPGKYRLTITPKDAAGNVGRSRRLRFTLLR